MSSLCAKIRAHVRPSFEKIFLASWAAQISKSAFSVLFLPFVQFKNDKCRLLLHYKHRGCISIFADMVIACSSSCCFLTYITISSNVKLVKSVCRCEINMSGVFFPLNFRMQTSSTTGMWRARDF